MIVAELSAGDGPERDFGNFGFGLQKAFNRLIMWV